MCRVDGLVVLAEELAAFLLRKVPENDLRIIWILYLNWLGGHASNVHRGPDAGPWRRGRIACRAALQPGGSYGLVCFRPEGPKQATRISRSPASEPRRRPWLSEDSLRALWDRPPFRMRELRQMRKTDGQEPCFGEDFLWVLLAEKEGAA